MSWDPAWTNFCPSSLEVCPVIVAVLLDTRSSCGFCQKVIHMAVRTLHAGFVGLHKHCGLKLLALHDECCGRL